MRDTGIEPVTSSVSGKRATAAPIAPVRAIQLLRWRRDSNPCKRLCRPVPSRSATPPCGLTPRAEGLPKKAPALERMTRLELATPTLARLCATNCATSAFRSRGLPRALVRHYPIPAPAQNHARPARVHNHGPWRACASGKVVESRSGHGRLAQLVARFLHTEEVIGSSPVSPTTTPVSYTHLTLPTIYSV